MLAIFLNENDKVYDLGCSTASMLIELSHHCKNNLKLIGIDNSVAMLNRAAKKQKLLSWHRVYKCWFTWCFLWWSKTYSFKLHFTIY